MRKIVLDLEYNLVQIGTLHTVFDPPKVNHLYQSASFNQRELGKISCAKSSCQLNEKINSQSSLGSNTHMVATNFYPN